MQCIRSRRTFGTFTITVVILIASGCWNSGVRKPENAKPTIPVHGTIFIDDEPGWGVKVYLWDESHLDPKSPTVPTGTAGEEGEVFIRTYGGNDGAPAGNYVLTFYWYEPKKGLAIGRGDPVDKFEGKYADKLNSDHKIVVEEGAESVDIGRIDLTNN